MQIAHKVRLNPNRKQETYFRKACGIARLVWNWGLARWIEKFQAGEKPSGMSLKKEFNAVKREKYPFIVEVTKYAAQQPFLDLQDAWSRHFKKLAEKPKFKKKGKCRDSFYVGGDQIKVKGRKIWIPNLGWVRMTEELRFQGKINSVVISRTADHWDAAIQVSTSSVLPKHENQVSVGVDLGVNRLATLSNGIFFESPKPHAKKLRKLKSEQRKLSKKVKGSKNYQKQKIKVARVHEGISNVRADFLHKMTSWITVFHSHIGIEDLNVRGMMANRKLSRAIADLGFYEIRRQLQYKTEWRGGEVIVHDRFYSSSKRCHHCGNVKKELSLSDRRYECVDCGLRVDRDLNAALNLNPLPAVRREITPVEMTALRKQAGLVFSTSIGETGSQLQLAC